jgi:hypothetical protein
MVRILALLSLCCLTACGGSRYSSANAVTSAATRISPSVAFARGPLQKACMTAGRKQASTARCGCIQAVANDKLSSSDQRRGVKFFTNPQLAQDTRQSDNLNSEAFWLRWKAYGEAAAKICG